MRIFEYFKPRKFYETLSRVIRSQRNWRFYKKQLKRLHKEGYLKQNGMRIDKRYRAYYVLNLEPETLMMGEEVLELERSRVIESLSMKKPVFERAELGELIEAKTDRIKTTDYYAYLIQIKYRPLANFWSVVYLIVWLAGFAGLVWLATLGAMQYELVLDWLNNMVMSK